MCEKGILCAGMCVYVLLSMYVWDLYYFIYQMLCCLCKNPLGSAKMLPHSHRSSPVNANPKRNAEESHSTAEQMTHSLVNFLLRRMEGMVGALARTSDCLSCLFVLQGWLEHGFLSCVPIELFRALACDFFFYSSASFYANKSA